MDSWFYVNMNALLGYITVTVLLESIPYKQKFWRAEYLVFT